MTKFRVDSVVTRTRAEHRSMLGVHPLSGVQLQLTNSEADDERNWFTIILGRNSTGKSQLLSDIAEALCIESGEFTHRRSGALDILLNVSSGEQKSEIRVGRTLDHQMYGQATNMLPSRIVASATTPFDKFRLSRDVIRERAPYRDEASLSKNQKYFYAGLRDSNGRTNFKSAILRTIRGIFLGELEVVDRLIKLRLVFEFLGLRPSVQVSYSIGGMSHSRKLTDAIMSDENYLDYILENTSNPYSGRIIAFLRETSDGLDRVKAALTNAMHHHHHYRHTGHANIEIGGNLNSVKLLNDLFLLKDLRLLSFREVYLQRNSDGQPLDILEASSGEISIISGMLGIASGIQDGSLILIDEPEISLHPEWQDRYLDLLRETFSAFRGCHFIIATHSPIIVSDARKEDTTVLNIAHVLQGRQGVETSIGKSIDEIVATQFGVVGDENLFLKQEIVKAANAVGRGETQSQEFRLRMSFLTGFSQSLPPNSKLAKVIAELNELTSHWK